MDAILSVTTPATNHLDVSIYYKPSLFNAHTMILMVHIFVDVNKLCLNQTTWTIEEVFSSQTCKLASSGTWITVTDAGQHVACGTGPVS